MVMVVAPGSRLLSLVTSPSLLQSFGEEVSVLVCGAAEEEELE